MNRPEIEWRVPATHPAFAGHFPGNPIVPGVVLLDRAIALAQSEQNLPTRGWGVNQVKFLSPCGPEDLLAFSFQPAARGAWAFRIRCGERLVASGELQPPAT